MVVAPLRKKEKVDKKFVYISPMPLGIVVASARLLKKKVYCLNNLDDLGW